MLPVCHPHRSTKRLHQLLASGSASRLYFDSRLDKFHENPSQDLDLMGGDPQHTSIALPRSLFGSRCPPVNSAEGLDNVQVLGRHCTGSALVPQNPDVIGW